MNSAPTGKEHPAGIVTSLTEVKMASLVGVMISLVGDPVGVSVSIVGLFVGVSVSMEGSMVGVIHRSSVSGLAGQMASVSGYI